MSKKLQVVVAEEDFEAFRRVARRRHLTLAEWVRQSLRGEARLAQPEPSTSKKLEVLRAATRHSYPTADIHQMLAEIEGGYQATDG